MGDEKDNLRRTLPFNQLRESLAAVGVEPRRGLVEEQHGSVGGEGARKGQALPLPHAELAATVEEAAQQRAAALGKPREERQERRGKQRAVVGGGAAGAEGDILVGGAAVAHKLLEENAETLAQLVGVEAPYVDAVKQHSALLGVVETQQELDERGLAVAVAAVDGGHLAAAGPEAVVAQHVALHVGIAESDVAELHLLDLLRHRQRVSRRQDVGLEVEELEEVAHEEAVVVEPCNTAHKAGEVALPAAERLEQHDERTHGDGPRGGLRDEEPDDEKHGGSLDESTEHVEHTQAPRDGEQRGDELAARGDETAAEERREAVGAHLGGGGARGQQRAVIGSEAVELRVLTPESIDAARLVEPHHETRHNGGDHHEDDPRRRREEHRHNTGDGNGAAAYGHEIAQNLQRPERRLLLRAVERVVIGGRVVVLHVEPRRLPLEEVAHMIDEALGEVVVVDAVEGGNDAVEQEDAAHGEQQRERGELRAGKSDGVNQELENVEVDERQHALQEDIEDAEPERASAALAYHHQSLPKILHRTTMSLMVSEPSSSLMRWRSPSRRCIISCRRAAEERRR